MIKAKENSITTIVGVDDLDTLLSQHSIHLDAANSTYKMAFYRLAGAVAAARDSDTGIESTTRIFKLDWQTNGDKISAIKFHRQLYGTSLIEAKTFIEQGDFFEVPPALFNAFISLSKEGSYQNLNFTEV